MKIIELLSLDDKEIWLNQLKECDWVAGRFLAELIEAKEIKETLGVTTLVLLLVDKDKIVSFCTYAEKDDIQPTDLTPWCGFVYTYKEYRGNHYAGMLLEYCLNLAAHFGKEYVYISTNHTGLYEKYGFEYYKLLKDIDGENSRVYRKSTMFVNKEEGLHILDSTYEKMKNGDKK